MEEKRGPTPFERFASFLGSPVYRGPSMNPTLKALDVLHIEPYHNERIRRGDVILFTSPRNGCQVVHRVVSVESRGIRTRGDTNPGIDPWILEPNRVLGRVVSIRRRNRLKRIPGGPLGRLAGGAVRMSRGLDGLVSTLLRPAYRLLARKHIFHTWALRITRIRILELRRPSGTEQQLLLGRRVIGRRLPGDDRWSIRRPYRLFVDEESLPDSISFKRCPRGEGSP